MAKKSLNSSFPILVWVDLFKTYLQRKILKSWSDVQRHWIEVSLILIFLFLFKNGSTRLFISIKQGAIISEQNKNKEVFSQPMNVSLIGKNALNDKESGNLANTYSNMVYTDPSFATNENERLKLVKRQKQKIYIEDFLTIAQEEMKKSKIPASITLAQGLLESNVGESKLAVKNNNHFGIKCFSKTCKRGHCSNFEDDTHKDFFRIYPNPRESYRSHSQLLKKDRYKPLYQLEIRDYKGWAHGLKKAGYATDPKYAFKIINLIEDLELYQYDLID